MWLARWRISRESNIPNGTVHGKTIESAQDPGLPDGQAVRVTVLPAPAADGGLRRSFGSWSDDEQGLDRFLAETQRDRKILRDQFSA